MKKQNFLSKLKNLDSLRNYKYKRRTIFIGVIILAFFITELTILWAVSESRVAYNPTKADVGSPVRKKRKERTLKPPPAEPKTVVKQEVPQATDSIIIRKLSVNAPVEAVGVTANGEMGTSKSLWNVAWYKDGTLPGTLGSAVLAGHSGAPDELGIFKNIDQLNSGDEIDYRFKDGNTVKYKIYKKATYPVNDMPLKDIFNKTGGKYLNLISCYGNWDYASSRYDKRIVVYAKAN